MSTQAPKALPKDVIYQVFPTGSCPPLLAVRVPLTQTLQGRNLLVWPLLAREAPCVQNSMEED